MRNAAPSSAGGGISYPSPFFDIASTWLPSSFRELYKWCRYFFYTNSTINTATFRLAEYPLTDLIFENEDQAVVERWKTFFEETLRFRTTQVGIGLDYNVYGVAYMTLHYPFVKMLTCRSCHKQFQASSIRRAWRLLDAAFHLQCPSCHHRGEADVKDQHQRSAEGIRIVRWNPEVIEVVTNEITEEKVYHLKLSQSVRNDVQIGKKEVVEKLPQMYIQAVRERKDMVLSEEHVFQIARPSLSSPDDKGNGIPALLPLLKDAFNVQVMKKSQESVLLERIIPLNVIFPQAGSSTSDIFSNVNLQDWRAYVAGEIIRWKQDPAYIPVMPIPIGSQTIGGDGKALLLVGELQAANDGLIIGMGMPPEVIRGNMQYSGGNVMLRQMENMFMRYMSHHIQFVHWTIKHIASFMGWPTINAKFKPLKMADDIQRKALFVQVSAANKISDNELLTELDLSLEKQRAEQLDEVSKRMEVDRKVQIETAKLQNELMLIQAQGQLAVQKLQMEAQQQVGGPPASMQSPNDPNQDRGQDGLPPGVDIRMMAQAQAQQISQMPPPMQQQALAQIAQSSPELAAVVKQMLGSQGGGGGGADPTKGPVDGVDARPLPEQRPPRRVLSSI
jgi:hypothetical protein